MSKSKVMVFRQGGRLAANETWLFKENPIEIVNEYTYLGVILTPRLSFQKHLEERSKKAKASINVTWKHFLSKPDIPFSFKRELFYAVCRAILCYVAQIWGFKAFEVAEKLQRFFIKKCLMLPDNTPNYALLLETLIPDNFLYCLEQNLNYLIKTVNKMSENRLPHQFTRKLVSQNISCFKELNILGHPFGINFSLDNIHVWESYKELLIFNLTKISYEKAEQSALQSSDRFYKHLDYSKGPSYLIDGNNKFKLMWIFKAQTDTFFLNANQYGVEDARKRCFLCDLREPEDIAHFIGRCLMLEEYRQIFYGKSTLSR